MIDIVKSIARDIECNEGRAFFVGGYVRDIIMGIESKDIDIEIFYITPEQLETILSQYGEVQTVGKSFGVYMIKGYDIDFCLPRTEKKIGNKHTDFKIEINPYSTYKDACRRRDFTMNAIMEDVLTGEIIDPFGGQDDIRAQVIRHVDAETFIEDPLRGLRACQFASRFNFLIDLETIMEIVKLDYSHLPKERIFEELKKGLLKSPKPSRFLFAMNITGINFELFPELQTLIGCHQNPKYHAEGDVMMHTKMVLDELAKIKHKSKYPLELMLAGLLHDIGKPITRKVTEKGITFHGHENESVKISKDVLIRLTDDKKLTERVLKLVENHMRPNKLAFTGSDKAIRKLMRDTDIHEILLLSQADHLGRISPESTRPKRYEEYRAWYNEKIEQLSTPNTPIGTIKPLVTGKDLIALGYKQGKIFKEILNFAMEEQLNGAKKEVVIKSILSTFE